MTSVKLINHSSSTADWNNLFEKKGKVYSKGYDAENIVQNINIDIILDKKKKALKQ